MKWFVLFIVLIMAIGFTVQAHETAKMKHGGTGECFGWKNVGYNMKMCYRNVEHTKCVYLVYAHGMWHVSEEFTCPEEE